MVEQSELSIMRGFVPPGEQRNFHIFSDGKSLGIDGDKEMYMLRDEALPILRRNGKEIKVFDNFGFTITADPETIVEASQLLKRMNFPDRTLTPSNLNPSTLIGGLEK